MNELIKKSNKIEDGNPTRYRLQTTTDNQDQSKSFRKIIFGERNTEKLHKTVLIVGETGSGKTTLINTMINYICGVQRKDKVWFEITDDQSNRSSVYSQTSDVTVYGVYIQETSVDLTIIDTPGYGDNRYISDDIKIAESFLCLCKSNAMLHEIDAVCLVIKADQNRLSDRQQYIFDAVQSLFGKDIAENIVLLFTHSKGTPPKNALTAVKEAKIKCAVNEKKNQPIYFLFDNCQGETYDEEFQTIQNQSWDLSFGEMTKFFNFLDTISPKTLQMTKDVLQKRNQLEANISNLRSRVEMTELKQNKLKQTQEALEKHKKEVKENNFEYKVEVPYKEKVDIDPDKAKKATCCNVCEENCHYPGCWWVKDVKWCSVMKKDHCTVCTNKCHYSTHIKEDKIYKTKKRVEKRTNEDLKKEYGVKIGDDESLANKLEKELHALDKDKINLVNEAFDCVKELKLIALNTYSLSTLLHIDFLIEKLKEIKEPEKAKDLEDIKKKAGERKEALAFYKLGFLS